MNTFLTVAIIAGVLLVIAILEVVGMGSMYKPGIKKSTNKHEGSSIQGPGYPKENLIK